MWGNKDCWTIFLKILIVYSILMEIFCSSSAFMFFILSLWGFLCYSRYAHSFSCMWSFLFCYQSLSYFKYTGRCSGCILSRLSYCISLICPKMIFLFPHLFPYVSWCSLLSLYYFYSLFLYDTCSLSVHPFSNSLQPSFLWNHELGQKFWKVSSNYLSDLNFEI